MDINTRGAILTFLYHIIILLLLLFFGFSYPDPPPEEEGILVNFGTSETGLGRTEPKGDEFQGGDIEVPEIVQVATPVPAQKPAVKEPVLKVVQDIEESPVKEKKPTEEELKKQELEKQRLEELRKQREEEERKKQQAEKIQSLGKSAFGTAGTGTTAGSEGITSGTGNQGSLGGTPGAETYSDGGGLGRGISFGLGDRKVEGLPKPLLAGCNVNSRIIVRVQINVDRDGKVVGEPRVLEATYQDECIYKAVIEAAAKAKFNADPNAEFRQQGWIRYIIDP